MLNNYILQTRSLLQLPGSDSTSLYTDVDLTRWINLARGQLAGEAECIRVLGLGFTVVSQRAYFISGLDITASPGVQAAINIRSIRYVPSGVPTGMGSIWIPGRPYEWFDIYVANQFPYATGAPEVWAQYGQGAAPGNTGSAAGGSFVVGPSPDAVYALICDCVCYPIPLVDDTTLEAIPYLFTDCVPFFAAYYALLSSQMGARYNDAIQMYKMYGEFLSRARKASNATPNRWQYEQAADPAQAAKMGVKAGAGA